MLRYGQSSRYEWAGMPPRRFSPLYLRLPSSVIIAGLLACDPAENPDQTPQAPAPNGGSTPAPELISISPSGAMRGANVTAMGSHLDDVLQIHVGSVIVRAFSSSETQVTFALPPNVEDGLQEVRALGPGGLSGALILMILPEPSPPFVAPRVFVIIPERLAPRTPFVVWGTGFGGDSEVFFGDEPVPTTRVDEFRLEATVPESVASTMVTVRTNGETSNAVNVELVFPPVVTSVTPTAARPGDSVEIEGMNLVSASVSILLASAPSEALPSPLVPEEMSADRIRVRIPQDLAPGVYELRISTPDGSTTATLTVDSPAPLIIGTKPFAVVPGHGLLIEGRGLRGARVSVGGAPAVVTYADDRAIAVIVDPGLSNNRSAPLVVETLDGTFLEDTVQVITSGSQATFGPAPLILPPDTTARPGIDNLWQLEYQSSPTQFFLQRVVGSNDLLTGQLRGDLGQLINGRYDFIAAQVEILIQRPSSFSQPELFVGGWAQTGDEDADQRMVLFSENTGDAISLVFSPSAFVLEEVGRCTDAPAVNVANSPFVGHFVYLEDDVRSSTLVRECAGASTGGPEAAYMVTLTPGDTLTARARSPTGTDLILSMVDDPCSPAFCYAGSNSAGPGTESEEVVTYTHASGVSALNLYVLVEQNDRSSRPGGSYRLELSIR